MSSAVAWDIDIIQDCIYVLLMSDDIRTRIRRLTGSQAAWAKATGQTVEHVSRVMTGKHPAPEWWTAVVELLEALPRKDWPERWG